MTDTQPAPEVIELLSSDGEDDDYDGAYAPLDGSSRFDRSGFVPPSPHFALPDPAFEDYPYLDGRIPDPDLETLRDLDLPGRLAQWVDEVSQRRNRYPLYDFDEEPGRTRHDPAPERTATAPDAGHAHREVVVIDDDPPDSPTTRTTGPLPDSSDSISSGRCSFAECFAKVQEIFPGISHDFVRKLYDEKSAEILENVPWDPSQQIIDEILQTPFYPKQKDKEKDGKRKRQNSQDGDGVDAKRWESSERPSTASMYLDRTRTVLQIYLDEARKLLQNEFPLIPDAYLRELLSEKKTLYAAFLALEATERDYETLQKKPYARLKKSRRPTSNSGPSPALPYPDDQDGRLQLSEELAAAKTTTKERDTQRLKEKKAVEAEALNTRLHEQQGSMVECQCCFGDAPMNRVVPCAAKEAHLFCHECIRNLISTEIGMSRAKVTCMDASGCKASLPKDSLRAIVDHKMFTKLEYLEQQAEIVSANIEGLCGCPFCDFKAICPPVAEDREFRCLNPACEKVSCRLCNEETHVPKSCEEAKKDKGLPVRHEIEEAMSEALIRPCPGCKVKIVKLDGCNKLTCTQCGCMMCYICKKDISGHGRGLGYDHFSYRKGGCRVHDEHMVRQGLDRHAVEVSNAEKAAIEKAKQENPELDEGELKVHTESKDVPSAQQPRRPILDPQHAFNMLPDPPALGEFFPDIPAPARLNPITLAPVPRALQGLPQNLGDLGRMPERTKRTATPDMMAEMATFLQGRTIPPTEDQERGRMAQEVATLQARIDHMKQLNERIQKHAQQNAAVRDQQRNAQPAQRDAGELRAQGPYWIHPPTYQLPPLENSRPAAHLDAKAAFAWQLPIHGFQPQPEGEMPGLNDFRPPPQFEFAMRNPVMRLGQPPRLVPDDVNLDMPSPRRNHNLLERRRRRPRKSD